uniref:Myosin_tail_1 domain-containing protein n=1 Tax=Gongylonema pulchrum TaxID=637853 RepID=A0A183D4X5_9BILA
LRKQMEEQLEESESIKQKVIKEAEKRNEELINELAKERQTIDDLKKELGNELKSASIQIAFLKENSEKALKEKDVLLGEKNAELEILKQQFNELNENHNDILHAAHLTESLIVYMVVKTFIVYIEGSGCLYVFCFIAISITEL